MREVPREIEPVAAIAVDCGFRLHRDFGPGLLEAAYEMMLEGMLTRRGLAVERQKRLHIEYEGMVFRDAFKIDLLVENCLIIEIKSVERLSPVHPKQVLTYLRMTGLPLGLLMNFGCATFREGVRRVANGRSTFAPLRLCVNPEAAPLKVDGRDGSSPEA